VRIEDYHCRAFNGGTFDAQIAEWPFQMLIKNGPVVIDEGCANSDPMLRQVSEQPLSDTQ